jgi:hypothetical protein
MRPIYDRQAVTGDYGTDGCPVERERLDLRYQK